MFIPVLRHTGSRPVIGEMGGDVIRSLQEDIHSVALVPSHEQTDTRQTHLACTIEGIDPGIAF